jgi:polysaccharide export outer membrane protein
MLGPARAIAVCWMVASLSLGCSLSPGQGIIFFPERHPLLETAEAFREAGIAGLPPPTELQKQTLPEYIVEPGDVLGVIVPEPIQRDNDLPVRVPYDQPVLPDGTIDLGRFGRLHVAGKSLETIEQEILSIIRQQVKELAYVDVRLVTRNSKVYYVLGEVNAPNEYPLSGRETVLDGLMAAGGLTDRASQDRIILARPTRPGECRIVLPVCYRQIVQLGDTSTNYQLLPGDRIFVPTRGTLESLALPGTRKHPKPCTICTGPQTPCPPVAVPTPTVTGTPTPGLPCLSASPSSPAVSPPGLPAPRPAPQLPGHELIPPPAPQP